MSDTIEEEENVNLDEAEDQVEIKWLQKEKQCKIFKFGEGFLTDETKKIIIQLKAVHYQ